MVGINTIVKALNSYMEISILPKYFDVGNVIPIWPGGNENKGKTKGCFDIQELYFAKYYDWFKALFVLDF